MVIKTDARVCASEEDLQREQIKATLNELNFPPSAQEIILNPAQCHTGITSITADSELILQVRKSISQIIDSLNENPSIFRHISKAWTKMTWWERIGAWLAVSGSPLVVGFVANIGFLIGLSVSTSIGTALLADDSAHSQDCHDKLKAGLFSISDALVLTISALNAVRQRLQKEVTLFAEENQLLSQLVSSLGSEVYRLKNQIESCEITTEYLRQHEINLSALVEKYAAEGEKSQILFAKTQEDLRETQQQHQRCIEQISTHNSELEKAKEELEIKLQQTNSVVIMLKETVKTLSITLVGDQEKRDAFQGKVEQFLSSKDIDFTGFATSMSQAEAEITSVREQLTDSLANHKQLVAEHKALLMSSKQLYPLIPEERQHSVTNGIFSAVSSKREDTPPPYAGAEISCLH